MGISVSDIMADDVFVANIELVAGRGGLDRKVQSISVMEVPDFPDGDVGQEMMILTTFSSYKDDTQAMENAFRKLADKNISALVVKTKRLNPYLNKIPEGLLAIADEKNVPLFLIEKANVPFREIIFSVMSNLVNYKFTLLQNVNRQYEELYGAIVRREKLVDFLKHFWASVYLPCICLSTTGEPIARYDAERKITPKAIQKLADIVRADEKGELSAQSAQPYSYDEFMIFPAMVNDGVGGYFIIRIERELEERELFFCRQMASFLSIKILEEYLLVESGQRATSITVDRILYGAIQDQAGLELRLENLGFTVQDKVCMLLIKDSVPRDSSTLDARHYSRFNHFTQYFKKEFPGSVVHTFAHGYIVFLSLARALPQADLKQKLLDSLESSYVGPDFCVGCGAMVDKITAIPTSFAGARSAVRFGGIFARGERVFFQSDFLEISAVSHLVGTEEHTAITGNIIAPIKEYDARYRSELWNSLETCLSSGSLKQASEQLFIHISTLRYRLNKILEITGVDYFQTNGRYLLQTASILDKIA